MGVTYDRLNRIVRNKYGMTVEYTPAGGVAREIAAVKEEDFFSETGGIGIQTETLALRVVDADVPELAAGDGFAVNGIDYFAAEVKPNFYGMTIIVLNKV